MKSSRNTVSSNSDIGIHFAAPKANNASLVRLVSRILLPKAPTLSGKRIFVAPPDCHPCCTIHHLVPKGTVFDSMPVPASALGC